MSDTAAAPAAPAVKKGVTGHVAGWVKGLIGMVFGVGSGVFVLNGTALVNQVVKPTLPVANFAVSTDGLTVTCQNHATGDSGWWDFGDGSTLDPFDAGQQAQTHTYAKAGTYSVKLTVRNMLMEENERTVPVDLTAAAPQSLPPAITGLTVDTLGGTAVAPAGFRISGNVANADHVIFDLGGGKPLVVETPQGPFEKFVVYDQPGGQTIRLTGVSGKTAVKCEASVDVRPPQVGTVSVVVKVTDSGSAVEKRTATPTVTVPLPKKGETRFERAVAADPGFVITAAAVGKLNTAVVKNVKLELNEDRKAGKLVGDWAAAGDALAKAAGKSDVMIPLTLTEERTSPAKSATETVSAVLNASGQTTPLSLPPQRLGAQHKERKIELQIVRAMPDGTQDVLVSEPDLKFPWKGATASRPGVGFGFGAALDGNRLQVKMDTKR